MPHASSRSLSTCCTFGDLTARQLSANTALGDLAPAAPSRIALSGSKRTPLRRAPGLPVRAQAQAQHRQRGRAPVVAQVEQRQHALRAHACGGPARGRAARRRSRQVQRAAAHQAVRPRERVQAHRGAACARGARTRSRRAEPSPTLPYTRPARCALSEPSLHLQAGRSGAGGLLARPGPPGGGCAVREWPASAASAMQRAGCGSARPPGGMRGDEQGMQGAPGMSSACRRARRRRSARTAPASAASCSASISASLRRPPPRPLSARAAATRRGAPAQPPLRLAEHAAAAGRRPGGRAAVGTQPGRARGLRARAATAPGAGPGRT